MSASPILAKADFTATHDSCVSRIALFGMPVDPVTMQDAVDLVERHVRTRTPGQHGNLNAKGLAEGQHNQALRSALWSCDLVTADGQGAVFAGRLLGHTIPQRVTGIDLMQALLERSARRGYRVYFLGARPEVVSAAAAAVESGYAGLRLVGYRHGYFSADEHEDVVAQVAAASPDIVFIGLGMPRQELFISRYRGRLGSAFLVPVGGAFDVLAGNRSRAPKWMQAAGLEWLFRLPQQPTWQRRQHLAANLRVAGLVASALMSGSRRGARG